MLLPANCVRKHTESAYHLTYPHSPDNTYRHNIARDVVGAKQQGLHQTDLAAKVQRHKHGRELRRRLERSEDNALVGGVERAVAAVHQVLSVCT